MVFTIWGADDAEIFGVEVGEEVWAFCGSEGGGHVDLPIWKLWFVAPHLFKGFRMIVDLLSRT